MSSSLSIYTEPANDPTRDYALVIGEPSAWLTAYAADQIRKFGDRSVVVLAGTEAIDFARRSAARQLPPQFVILAQERPGQIAKSIPEELKALLPAADLLSLAGSWCEGEMRTGSPWPDVPRRYWHQLPAWLASREQTGSRETRPRGLVAVDATHRETASAIIDTLADVGQSAVWLPRYGANPLLAGCSAGVWVGGQLDGLQSARLGGFCQAMRRRAAPTLAVLDFPRPDELHVATQLGVSAVLGMPWSADELVATLRQLPPVEPIVAPKLWLEAA